MNKNDLLVIVKNSNQLSKKNLVELHASIKKYPYFLGARMLFAKAAYQLKSNKSKSILSSTLIYSTDRAILKKFILNGAHGNNETRRNISSKVFKKKVVKVVVNAAHLDEKALPVNNLPKSNLDALLIELGNDMNQLKEARMRFSQLQQSIEDAKEIPTTTLEKNEVIIEESIQELTSETKNVETDNQTILNEIPREKKQGESIIPDSSLSQMLNENNILNFSDISQDDLESLKKIKKMDTLKKEEESKIPQTHLRVDVSKPFRYEISSESEHNGKKGRYNDVIDKFVKASPSPIRASKNVTSSVDLSEESSSLDSDIASEYLAEIYLKQGQKDQAIAIYKILMQKYPDKKMYLAGLISKIQ